MGKVEHAPFDPSDPFDAMSEMFRRQMLDMVLQAEGVTLYRELDSQRQIECFVAGALTGLICACLASVKPESYDAITEYVASCIPMARNFADSIKVSPHGG